MKIELKCENCGKIVGWKNSDFEISEKITVSCGSKKCNEVVVKKV